MKPLVIYHADCADGFGAAFSAWLVFGDEADYLPMRYLKQSDGMREFEAATNYCEIENREVYILDFSLPRIVMEVLFQTAKRVVWLDHHKTAFEMWCGEYYPGKRYTQPLVSTSSSLADHPEKNTVILDDTKSGAMLAWEYFHPNKEVPMLIRHIDDYDRWQFKLEGTKEFNKALWSYAPWSFGQWDEYLKEFDLKGWSPFSQDWENSKAYRMFIDGGAAILRAQDSHIQQMLKQMRRCEITLMNYDIHFQHPDVFQGLALNTPMHMSEVGHELANRSETYGLVWYMGEDNRVKCSLRSNGDYDVSKIAKEFGGGGHKNAAGFEVDIQTLLNWIK